MVLTQLLFLSQGCGGSRPPRATHSSPQRGGSLDRLPTSASQPWRGQSVRPTAQRETRDTYMWLVCGPTRKANAGSESASQSAVSASPPQLSEGFIIKTQHAQSVGRILASWSEIEDPAAADTRPLTPGHPCPPGTGGCSGWSTTDQASQGRATAQARATRRTGFLPKKDTGLSDTDCHHETYSPLRSVSIS